MKLRCGVSVLALCLGVSSLAAAATLKGVVRNGTTGKPAAGDEVLLLSRTGVTVRGKTDASGRFRLAVANLQAPLAVRVNHQGVGYQNLVREPAKPVEVQVYDVVQKLDGVTATSDVQSFQTEGNKLQVIEEIAVRNASVPPRTLRTVEIQLPPEAEIVAGRVQMGGGRPVTSKPTAGDQKGRYFFPFPLPPGDTRFAVAYRLPYKGEAMIEPKIVYPLEQLVVMLPKTMKFEARTPGMFQPRPDQTKGNVQVVAAVKPSQPLAFRISGTGTLVKPSGAGPRPAGSGAAESGADSRPPGRATPAKLPYPFILGGLALVLAAGVAGFLAHKRKQPQHLSAKSGAEHRNVV